MRRRISFVYWIASMMGKRIDYRKAQALAAHFSEAELVRIYLAKRRMS